MHRNIWTVTIVVKIDSKDSVKERLTMPLSPWGGGGDTLEILGWKCAAGTPELIAYTRPSSGEFCYPILD